ncbi:MAG: tRNA 2-thiouridine(34) synthase MnmA [Betaproteobacteria bacterium]|nr:tRNA 2-thiouridine(34) synthase MnmA [Betaproteobacteria bacterium]
MPAAIHANAKRVVVGMSGGVDSSVAAWLLKEQGFEVTGLFMKNWEDDDTDEFCTAREDLIDAVSVADRIGVEIEAVNFSVEYKERVFSNFLAEYQAGRTPNPDVLCNSEIKFKAFLDHAIGMGAGRIATGHYARVRERDGAFELLRGLDTSKDQSYFLHRLNQAQLSRTLFPVGELKKSEVREIARRIGLANHAKRDSTGICFIGERPFREFLMRYLAPKPGPMQTPEGKTVGEHQGLMYYTIGQRQGLGIGGAGEPWYVIDKDMPHNRLIVAQGHDHCALYRTRLFAGKPSWISGFAPDGSRAYGGKTRYRQTDAPCRFMEASADSFSLAFDAPQWAITPGQSAVLYDADVCLGGGIIS